MDANYEEARAIARLFSTGRGGTDPDSCEALLAQQFNRQSEIIDNLSAALHEHETH